MYEGLKVLIADDMDLILEGICNLLRNTNISICSIASDGRELVQMVEQHQPDVVITDIQMPLMDGIEATRLIKERYPAIPVIALTMFDDEGLLVDMMEADADGYLLKTSGKEEVLRAIEEVYKGRKYYCKRINNMLPALIARSRKRNFLSKIEFTESEKEVMKCICQEYSTKEIAGLMGMTVNNIEKLRSKIMSKIGAKNSVGVGLYAFRNKLYKD